ncbi:hypothetical protein Ait01nite_025480 [Actinoplanes italicus]|uniref:Uncharacterized protein DUF1707 n=1 Tax=Actinoplanes italicus TaxID=113567 RepID=A0A2T0KFF5_9ACTN|nr:DUF1707 domain-containing protein [Actinoplanes italicus]PRX22081.1 uncharacterized protein DUF1707 [Actinoplanes italicus]GIE29503.1 hypothetical protein Ait01nite_025480 [Actinoplanes italicus]
MTDHRVRASNVQREQVVASLNQALVEGRISLPEFEQRSTAASFTVWADELAAFTTDLLRRATYEQRAHVVERLGEAAAQGYLKFPEFEERAAGVSHTVWATELTRFTTDLPRAFRSVPQAAMTSTTGLAGILRVLSGLPVVRIAQRHPAKAAAAAAALVLAGGAGIALTGGEPETTTTAAPVAAASVAVIASPSRPAPTVSSTTYAATPAMSSPTPTPSTAPREITIECNVGDSDDKVTYTSLEEVWAENSGTYFCEASVPDSHRLTKAEKKAVVIDQRIGNGDSIIDSLGVLISLCANTVEYEITDEETRPTTVRDFEHFDEDRLEAVYKLCPNAPTAKLMREVIYS